MEVVGARSGWPGALEAEGEEVGGAADDLAPQQEGLVGQEGGLQAPRALHCQRLPFCQADVLHLPGMARYHRPGIALALALELVLGRLARGQ